MGNGTRRVWDLRIARESADRRVLLRAAGRVSRANTGKLGQALDELAAQGGVLDLEGIDYISAAGLAIVDEAVRRAAAAGRPLILCGLQDPVRIAFDLAGLLPALRVEPDCPAALARLNREPAADR
jgi:anti-anti-sigma factor